MTAMTPDLAGYSDRACAPEETLARIVPLLREHGVTRLARITGLDRIGIPVWNAIRPNARSIAIHQGKGIRDIDAKVSAAMEALERAIAEQPPIPVRSASRRQLIAEGQAFEPLDTLIAAGHAQADEATPVDWVEGYEIASGRSIWIPRQAVVLDRTKPSRYWQSSDGLASGNTLDEAVFHGLLERIERDADVLWTLSRPRHRSLTCVDPGSLGDPVVDRLSDQISTAGFRLQLFDITSDIGIPAFSALVAPVQIRHDLPLRYSDVSAGSGAHPVGARAAIRAITEAVQSRLTLISGARDDVAPDTYSKPLPQAIDADLRLEPGPWKHADAALAASDLQSMLDMLLHRLAERKIRTAIVVPLNPDDSRMAVAKVIVPDLENPAGARKQRFGRRALEKMLVFR